MGLLLLMRRALVLLAFLLTLPACTGVFFQPLRPHVRTPDQIGLAYEDVWFDADDGVRLHGWFLPASGTACGTLLFLHGNAENISTHIGSVYWLPERGFNVFLPDYRGYGASAGSPTLAGMQADIDAALRYLLARPDVRERGVVIFGQSLGGAAAIYYTAHSRYREQIRALVIESAFSSHRAIAREKLASFWLTWLFAWPLSWTISDDHSPVAVIDRVAPVPLLLVNGDQDRIVPPDHSRRLFRAAREPKELWEVGGAGHIAAFRAEPMRSRFVDYLSARACPGSGAAKQ